MDLLSALGDGWRSGEDLAAELDVSRAAVSKAAGVLTEAGIPVEVERATGYRLAPGTPTPHALANAVRGRGSEPVSAYRYLGRATSTQDELRSWASEDAPVGAVVLAETQTEGRGRRGRTWTSPEPGAALTFSMVLRPDVPLTRLPLLPLAAGVALARAVGGGAHVKWPNDLLAPDDRKLAGVLVEAQTSGDEVDLALVGIGLNVIAPAPEGGAAVSELEVDEPSRVSLLARVLDELRTQAARLADDPEGLLADWRANTRMLGRPVRVLTAAGTVTGSASDLDPGGGLIVTAGDGTTTLVNAGDVEMIDERKAAT